VTGLRILAALALACVTLIVTTGAEARQHHKTYAAHDDCNGTYPNAPTCIGVAPSARGERVVKAMGGFGVARKVYMPRFSTGPKANKNGHKLTVSRLLSTAPSYGATSPSFAYSIARPVRYIAGRLICAINVGAALAERGIKGTGSALALSYLRWGRSAGGPVPGAVIVSARPGGGHVAIVSRIKNGVVYAWNATGGQRGWREIPYRHHVIDYRVPG
jgi:hypothetical protein